VLSIGSASARQVASDARHTVGDARVGNAPSGAHGSFVSAAQLSTSVIKFIREKPTDFPVGRGSNRLDPCGVFSPPSGPPGFPVGSLPVGDPHRAVAAVSADRTTDATGTALTQPGTALSAGAASGWHAILFSGTHAAASHHRSQFLRPRARSISAAPHQSAVAQ
jgi:hypothetical protein